MKKRINIGIVNVDPYSENLGVGALAYSTLFILDLLSENLNYIFDLFIIMDSVPKRKDTFYIGESKIDVRFVRQINLLSAKGLIRGLLSLKLLKSTIISARSPGDRTELSILTAFSRNPPSDAI